MKRIIAGLLLAGVAGCASGLSEEECRPGLAPDIGYDDGLNGLLASHGGERAEQCARYDLTFNRTGYDEGWQRGIAVFCTPQGALQTGLAGKGDIRACPSADALTRDAHRVGLNYAAAERNLREARSNYDSLLSSMDSLRRNIDKTRRKYRDEPDANQRKELSDRIYRYRRDLRDAESRIYYARDQIRYAERDLDRAEYELVRLRARMRDAGRPLSNLERDTLELPDASQANYPVPMIRAKPLPVTGKPAPSVEEDGQAVEDTDFPPLEIED